MSKNSDDSKLSQVYIRQSGLIPSVLPFSAPTLWRLIQEGKFPKPVKLTERVTAWRCKDIKEWLKSKDEGME